LKFERFDLKKLSDLVSINDGINIHTCSYRSQNNNITFTSGQSFGRGVNQITPLFSNDVPGFPAAVSHTSGFVKLFNPSGDCSVGWVVFFQPGERTERMKINHRFGQLIGNAVVCAAHGN